MSGEIYELSIDHHLIVTFDSSHYSQMSPQANICIRTRPHIFLLLPSDHFALSIPFIQAIEIESSLCILTQN